MRIAFRKLTDERHALEVFRDDGSREEIECETRSFLEHDLLHFAVEREAGLQSGFWGHVARGMTLARTKDRGGIESSGDDDALAAIEQVVGALSGLTRGRSAAELALGMGRFAEALGKTPPAWLTEQFIAGVQERMRQLLGRWRATTRGGAMDLSW